MKKLVEIVKAYEDYTQKSRPHCQKFLTESGKKKAKNGDCCCDVKSCMMFSKKAYTEEDCNLTWNCKLIIAKFALKEALKTVEEASKRTFVVTLTGNCGVTSDTMLNAIRGKVGGDISIEEKKV